MRPSPALAKALREATARLRAELRADGFEPFGFEVRGRGDDLGERWEHVTGVVVVGKDAEGSISKRTERVDGAALAFLGDFRLASVNGRLVRRSKPRP